MKGKVSKDDATKFVREARLMRKCHHENIVGIYGVTYQEEPMMIVIELAEIGELKEYVEKNRDSIPPDRLYSFVRDAARGMCYLSCSMIIHRDLAARNCLLGAGLCLKISDFGLSMEVKKEQPEIKMAKLTKVPIKWSAPETLREGIYSTKSDVWSFGIMTWEIYSLCKTEPFPAMTNGQAKEKILSEAVCMENWKTFSAEKGLFFGKTFSMSLTSVSSLFGALKTSGVFSSKTAVLAVFLVGVEEYYLAGIYKIIQKIVEKSGNEYECSRKERLDFVWIFDDSGLYAAAVYKSDWFLSITIYDCMEKKAYNYLEQFTELKPDYFYWFNGDLILMHIDQYNCIQQIHIKIDHETRKAKKITTRNYDFPFLIMPTGECRTTYMKNERNKPLVEYVETVVLDKEEHIILMSLFGSAIVIIPKDPNSPSEIRYSIYFHPHSEIRVGIVYSQILPTMAHKQFLYFPKMSESAYESKEEQKYILDGFIEVNLLEQENLQAKDIDLEQMWIDRNHSGKEVLFSHVGSKPVNISQPRNVISAKRYGNGKVLAVVEGDNLNKRYSCLIEVKLKKVTWRKWEPKIQRKSNMILASLHPRGYFIEIDYRKKQEDDKFKLFSKIVAHPNEPIKLKTMSLVNLFTTEMGIVYSQILPTMAHKQFLYFPKMSESAYESKEEQKYILDGFIEVNLLEQENLQAKDIDLEQMWIDRNHSGKEVLFSHVGSKPVNISQPRNVISAKRYGNGKVLAVVEGDNLNKRYSCLIEVKLKKVTWRKWEPKIQRKSNMILASLHPRGYFIEIDYRKKQEDDKFKLFSKIVAHPNEPIKLKTMSLVNLFTTESSLELKLKNYIRRFL